MHLLEQDLKFRILQFYSSSSRCNQLKIFPTQKEHALPHKSPIVHNSWGKEDVSHYQNSC